MKSVYLIFIVYSFLLISCGDDDFPNFNCGINNPVEEADMVKGGN